MAHRRISMVFAAAALLALPMQPGARADTGAKIIEEVDFAISCSPAVQQPFKHAVWTLHSFWYPEALKEFTAITEAEPGCAMGYWGIAMSHWYPLWYPPSPAALKAGSEAVEKAMAAPTKTEREKDYIAAIATFYRDSDKLDHRTRAVAYEKAMEQVYLRYPEDREAAVFYALALNATALPTDKTYANKQQGGGDPRQGLEGAAEPSRCRALPDPQRRLGAICPGGAGRGDLLCEDRARRAACAAHALAHLHPAGLVAAIDRLEPRRSCRGAGLCPQDRSGQDGFDSETVHTMDYLEYAYLQTAQDGAAKEVVDELLGFRKSASAEPADGLCRRGDPGALRA